MHILRFLKYVCINIPLTYCIFIVTFIVTFIASVWAL